MVFFVLPKGEGQNQLGRRESFLNTAQHILLMSNDEAEKKRASRILIVPDINQVINAISSVMQSLAPAKREKKKQYFAQRASQYYLPNQETGKDPTQAAIANHVSKTFHAWAERMGLPEGDSNVLLNIMGSLGDVATADDKALDDLPIRNVTKEIVSTFFGSSKSNEEPNNANDDTFDTGSITEAFDDIEDNEFLQIPNPNVMENTHPSQWQSENVHEEFNGFQENSYTQEQFFQPNHNNTRSVHSFAHGTNNFSNELDYTPIQPTYQSNHYHPREQYVEISIIPESFAQHHNFTPHSMQHGHGYRSSHSNGRAAPFRSASRSNYQRDNGFGPQQSM
ncbi:hypothetical protein ACHAWO_003676 [Cyclotella atomus]|uniref:Uncharacterized protein n=1 Tax=Cyclotella atomus TaxID=382360 RepID=A0ABD3N7M6_9STRA